MGYESSVFFVESGYDGYWFVDCVQWRIKNMKVEIKGLQFIINLFFLIALLTTVQYFILNVFDWYWDLLFVTSYWLMGFGLSILLARFLPFFRIDINIPKR